MNRAQKLAKRKQKRKASAERQRQATPAIARADLPAHPLSHVDVTTPAFAGVTVPDPLPEELRSPVASPDPELVREETLTKAAQLRLLKLLGPVWQEIANETPKAHAGRLLAIIAKAPSRLFWKGGSSDDLQVLLARLPRPLTIIVDKGVTLPAGEYSVEGVSILEA